MARHHSSIFDARLVGFLLGAALLLPGGGVADASDGVAEDSGVLSVPAEFVFSFRLPGLEDLIKRPSAVFVDRTHGEVLIGDSSRNRVLIFDQAGTYKYEFSFTDQMGSVVDLAVDSSGFIYVLGTTREGRRVHKYDFDGVFLEVFSMGEVDPGKIESMTIDDQDQVILIDDRGVCYVVNATGQLLTTIDTMAVLPDASSQLEMVRGKPSAYKGLLYLPASSLGSVLVFELATGQALPSIGFRGNTPGQLNFPVAVEVLPSGVVAVLDKMRFTVLCFAPSGRFLGEFGGRGFRDGWFYHPILLAAVGEDRIVVGQVLDQRVQVLRVPDFVFTRLSREPVPAGRRAVEEDAVSPTGSDPRSP